MLKYFNIFTVIFFVFRITNLFAEETRPLKERTLISKRLGWDNNITVTINQIRYEKNTHAKGETGDIINLNIQDLRDFFLNKAVEVSGIEINYSYSYEYVYIAGILSAANEEYEFYYNLAGFCYIKNTNVDIIIADPAQEFPMVPNK